MRYVFFYIFVLMLLPAGAQSHDLAGVWQFSNADGSTVQVQLSSQGNSWVGSSLSKQTADLKLNPAGLRNQWVGDFTTDQKYSVKADLKSGQLLLTDLDHGGSWTLSRAK